MGEIMIYTTKITSKIVQQVKELSEIGLTHREISSTVHISTFSVFKILRGDYDKSIHISEIPRPAVYHKQGRSELAEHEKRFIAANCDKIPVTRLAAMVRRSYARVMEYMNENGLQQYRATKDPYEVQGMFVVENYQPATI